MNAENEWINSDDVEIPDDLPQPIYWRILVMPVKPKKVSRGGIVMPDMVQSNEEWLNYIGKVVAMGGCAGKSSRFEGEGNLPKVGDWIIYGKYAGQKVTHKGVKLLFINDDEVLGVVTNPDALKVYV